MSYCTINNLIRDKNKSIYPVQMIPIKWNSAYDYTHVGLNMKFVTEEKKERNFVYYGI